MPDDKNNIQTPYALAKLEESARAIKQAVSELPALRKRLDKLKLFYTVF